MRALATALITAALAVTIATPATAAETGTWSKRDGTSAVASGAYEIKGAAPGKDDREVLVAGTITVDEPGHCHFVQVIRSGQGGPSAFPSPIRCERGTYPVSISYTTRGGLGSIVLCRKEPTFTCS
ncbi:hypothetical protein [Allokutzneria oryzae]|uniref:Secreted protein n=1 Tax=Allokutzneria oryzae TaxID=1378989 RepID=A0ABV6A7C3_9PSEU